MSDLDDLRRRADRFDPPRAEPVVVPGAKCKGCDGPITARPGYEALKDYCSRTCEDRAWRRRKKAEREALEARVSLLAPFSLSHEGEFTWLVYEHAPPRQESSSPMNDPNDPAYFRDEVVQKLQRIWPEPLVCDASVWMLMGDDPRVVTLPFADDRWRLALAACPEGGDT